VSRSTRLDRLEATVGHSPEHRVSYCRDCGGIGIDDALLARRTTTTHSWPGARRGRAALAKLRRKPRRCTRRWLSVRAPAGGAVRRPRLAAPGHARTPQGRGGVTAECSPGSRSAAVYLVEMPRQDELAALRPGGVGRLLRGVFRDCPLAPLHRRIGPYRRVTPNDCGVSGLSGRDHRVSRLPNALRLPRTASCETHHDHCTCEYEPHISPPSHRSRLAAGRSTMDHPVANSVSEQRGCGDGPHASAKVRRALSIEYARLASDPGGFDSWGWSRNTGRCRRNRWPRSIGVSHDFGSRVLSAAGPRPSPYPSRPRAASNRSGEGRGTQGDVEIRREDGPEERRLRARTLRRKSIMGLSEDSGLQS
jgi:hypothetical protein